MIIYDCEIKKGILGKKDKPVEGIEYCDGWRDFGNMGISVIGVYDFERDVYAVYMDESFNDFQNLVNDTDIVIGFNSLAFDNRLCSEHGIVIRDNKSYDLLVKIWQGLGYGPEFKFGTHAGYGLDAVAKANLNTGKTGYYGGNIPIEWQRGNYSTVINYCLNDVKLTRDLVQLVMNGGKIKNPKMSGMIRVDPPK